MFELRKLPYAKTEFSDFLSEVTFDYHYGKHHNTYVTNLNNLIKDSELAKKGLIDIIFSSGGGIFNNAAQVYNHDFYWDCITPKSSNPTGELLDEISWDFGSIDGFKEKFLASSTSLFGSGWNWLVLTQDNRLEIVQTSNAATPITDKKIPLLVVDVWEHAYYVDFKNARPTYLEKFFTHINWDFVASNLKSAKKNGLEGVRDYVNKLHPLT